MDKDDYTDKHNGHRQEHWCDPCVWDNETHSHTQFRSKGNHILTIIDIDWMTDDFLMTNVITRVS